MTNDETAFKIQCDGDHDHDQLSSTQRLKVHYLDFRHDGSHQANTLNR